MDGPSNGHREEKDDKKPEVEKEATSSSEGKDNVCFNRLIKL